MRRDVRAGTRAQPSRSRGGRDANSAARGTGCGTPSVCGLGPERWWLFTQGNTVQHVQGLCSTDSRHACTEQWRLGSTLRWGGERPEPSTGARAEEHVSLGTALSALTRARGGCAAAGAWAGLCCVDGAGACQGCSPTAPITAANPRHAPQHCPAAPLTPHTGFGYWWGPVPRAGSALVAQSPGTCARLGDRAPRAERQDTGAVHKAPCPSDTLTPHAHSYLCTERLSGAPHARTASTAALAHADGSCLPPCTRRAGDTRSASLRPALPASTAGSPRAAPQILRAATCSLPLALPDPRKTPPPQGHLP